MSAAGRKKNEHGDAGELYLPVEREGKVVENADFLTDEEKEDILADNVFRFVGRNREDYL